MSRHGRPPGILRRAGPGRADLDRLWAEMDNDAARRALEVLDRVAARAGGVRLAAEAPDAAGGGPDAPAAGDQVNADDQAAGGERPEPPPTT